MNYQEIQRVVSSIQRSIFKRANAQTSGILKSQMRGSGLQFKEHQVYVPGDDIRFIDWKLSAKTSHTYIKTFEEERNVEIVVMVDISDTLFMGSDGISKMQAIIEVVAMLYLLANSTHDSVRVILLTDQINYLPLEKGHAGIAQFIKCLGNNNLINSNGKVNLEYQIENKTTDIERKSILKRYLTKKREVVYLSDYSGFQSIEELKSFLSTPRFNAFLFYSPIEKSSKYNFWTRVDNKWGEISSRQVEEKSYKRLHELGTHEKYLEQFVGKIA